MMKLTIAQIHAAGCCAQKPGEKYSAENLRKLFGGQDEIDVIQGLDLPIPEADRLWVIFHTGILSKKTLRLLAADFAEEVLPVFEKRFPNDLRVRELIQGIRDFAHEKIDRTQLNTLRAAAYDAAAEGAAFRAATAAYTAAAEGAAYAAYAAYAAAAAAATTAASRSAIRQSQIQRVRAVLIEELKERESA